MALDTQSHRALFSASDINILQSEEEDQFFLQKIGPDILDEGLTWKVVSRRLSDKFRNRQLASLFLDQSFLAGVGNYLRSEILFDARANPLKPKELALKSKQSDQPKHARNLSAGSHPKWSNNSSVL